MTMPPLLPQHNVSVCLSFVQYRSSRVMLCRTSVNILKAPCVVFISQWEGVKVFARVSGCVTLSVNITSHTFFLPHSVRLLQPVPFRARACVSAVSVAGVTAGLSVQEAWLAHRQVVNTATMPFYLLHVTCFALCRVWPEVDTRRHCSTLFPQLRYRCP